MLDIHAIADDWQNASEWRDGSARVRSWSIRDVATGRKLASVRLDLPGSFVLDTGFGSPMTHRDLSGALSAARDALAPSAAPH